MATINGSTQIQATKAEQPKNEKARFRYEATANGVTGVVMQRSQVPIRAEPISINGKVGVVFRDAHGDPIRYVLRPA